MHADSSLCSSRGSVRKCPPGPSANQRPVQGVIVYFRVKDGRMKPGDTVKLMNTQVEHEILDMGVLAPKPVLVRPR